VPRSQRSTGRAVVEAGAELLVVSSLPQQADAYEAVVAAVESGEMPGARIRNSVERLLRVKESYHSRGAGRH
jgi:beta-N-acetylhexosaminidase